MLFRSVLTLLVIPAIYSLYKEREVSAWTSNDATSIATANNAALVEHTTL